MIEETPEDWGTPLMDLFNEIVLGKPKDVVRAQTPSGTIIEMPREQFNSKVAVGLSLREVEDETY